MDLRIFLLIAWISVWRASDAMPVAQPLDGCEGESCICPPGTIGVQPFCRPDIPPPIPDMCVGDSCICPPGMTGVEPFCRPMYPPTDFPNPNSRTACQLAKAEADRNSATGMVGHVIPKCESDGKYSPVQCHGSTGHCWCAQEDGTEIQGTRIRFNQPDCSSFRRNAVTTSKCLMEKADADRKSSMGMVGHMTPSCESNGDYSSLQCHGSTGHCWCVSLDGTEIMGTRLGPGNGRPQDCDLRRNTDVGPKPLDKCEGEGCKCPPGMIGVEPFCRKPDAGDICQLPSMVGFANGMSCMAMMKKFYYNSEKLTCEEFVFGGCGEEVANRFDTMEECQKMCGGTGTRNAPLCPPGMIGTPPFCSNSGISPRSEDCPQFCPLNYAPVCDSDGKTHANECAFDVASCEAGKLGKTLTLVKKVACEEDECKPSCTREMRPVCDKEGKKYNNKCLFDYAACIAKKSGNFLTMAPCLDIEYTTKPEILKTGICAGSPQLPCCEQMKKVYDMLNTRNPPMDLGYPSCRDDGYYEAKQCHWVGCYCVTPEGKSVDTPSGASGPGNWELNCDAPMSVDPAQSCAEACNKIHAPWRSIGESKAKQDMMTCLEGCPGYSCERKCQIVYPNRGEEIIVRHCMETRCRSGNVKPTTPPPTIARRDFGVKGGRLRSFVKPTTKRNYGVKS